MAAERKVARLTKRVVDTLQPAEKAYRVWDNDLKGFGVRISPKAAKTYFIYYRAGPGRNAPQRDFTLGRHGVLTPDQARDEAKRLLGSVRMGEDPQATRSKARLDINVAELCDLYIANGVGEKKESTLRADRARIRAHIKPLLGRKLVSQVTDEDVKKFMRDIATGKTAVQPKMTAAAYRQLVREAKAAGRKAPPMPELRSRTDQMARGGKGTATRTVGLLGGIFSYAIQHKIRGDNPVAGVSRYSDRKSDRYLTGAELTALAKALARAEADGANTAALSIIRLLLLTGARKAEIERLTWSEVDFQHSCLRLRDSKTGQKIIPVGAAALAVIEAQHREKGAVYVFPGNKQPPSAGSKSPKPAANGGYFGGADKIWVRSVRPMAELDGVRIHDLRHTYASIAASGGQSLPIIGAILGHRDVKTTARYAHLANDPVRSAVERNSEAMAAAMSGSSAEVVPLRRA